MRAVHCSDLHFFRPELSKELFTSKQFSSLFFHLLARSGRISDRRLFKVIDLWQSLGVQRVFLTGDCTTLSTPMEYERFSLFAKELEKRGMILSVVPGNHDAFTPLAMREKRFHTMALPEHQRENPPLFWADKLSDNWSLIGLDCAIPTPAFRAYGKIRSAHLTGLTAFLAQKKPGSHLIIMNHFPLMTSRKEHYKALRGSRLCAELLQEYTQLNIIYLTGHTHIASFVDGRELGLPIQLNSGSLRFIPGSSWNLLDLTDDGIQSEIWRYRPTIKTWEKTESHAFSFSKEPYHDRRS